MGYLNNARALNLYLAAFKTTVLDSGLQRVCFSLLGNRKGLNNVIVTRGLNAFCSGVYWLERSRSHSYMDPLSLYYGCFNCLIIVKHVRTIGDSCGNLRYRYEHIQMEQQ